MKKSIMMITVLLSCVAFISPTFAQSTEGFTGDIEAVPARADLYSSSLDEDPLDNHEPKNETEILEEPDVNVDVPAFGDETLNSQ